MAIDKKIADILTDPASVVALATADHEGRPHVVFKNHLSVSEDSVFLLEFIETSRTSRNLTDSIWFGRTVALNVLAADGRSFQLKGVPVKAHISGARYEQAYTEILGENPDVDLGAVWEIEIRSVRDNTPGVRIAEERERHPWLFHLDRIAKGDAQ